MNRICARASTAAVLLAVAFSSLSGCAGMGAGYETPTVTVQSFRPVPSDAGSGLPEFEIVLRVINPNLEPLELAGVSYTISLDGHDLITGVGNRLPVIDGYGEGTFTINAGVNLMAGVRLFRSLMAKDTEGVDYRFEAKLDPGRFRPKIRVTDSGSISFSDR